MLAAPALSVIVTEVILVSPDAEKTSVIGPVGPEMASPLNVAVPFSCEVVVVPVRLPDQIGRAHV